MRYYLRKNCDLAGDVSELLIMSGFSSTVKTTDPKYDLILLGFKWSIAGTKNNVLTLKFIHFL